MSIETLRSLGLTGTVGRKLGNIPVASRLNKILKGYTWRLPQTFWVLPRLIPLPAP